MKKVNRKKVFMAFAGVGGLGAVGATAVTVVACSPSISYYNIMPTYTGEADILLSLGIAPDYYPYQLNQTKPYTYVSDPKAYMTYQSDDFKNKFEAKVKSLSAQFKDVGRSWWNQDANKSDKSNPDAEYWTHKDAQLFLYEQYLLDDSYDVINSSTAPTYKNAIKTNFRVSRDPYTRLSKEEIDDHDNITGFFYGADGKVKPALVKDLNFASEFAHRSEEDSYYGSLLYKDTDPVFSKEAWKDKLLAGYYDNATLSADVKAAGLTKTNYLKRLQAGATFNYSQPSATAASNNVSPQGLVYSTAYARSLSANFASSGYLPLEHHPIYEAQTELGEAPAYEGAVRDNLIYLYTVASDLTKTMNENPTLLANDPRRPAMVKAQENAKAIIKNFRDRQTAIKAYFDKIGVTGKTFAMVTVAPGEGQDTLQTDSKYAFLFDEIGLKYPWPKDWTEDKTKTKTTFSAADSTVSADKTRVPLFNLDDNGWFFDISNDSKEQHLNIEQFKETADFGVIAVRDLNWNNKSLAEQGYYKQIFKTDWQPKMEGTDYRVDYDLWNEGIKTPSVLNIVLDKVVNAAAVYAVSQNGGSGTPDTTSTLYKAAMDWGNYWTDTYVNG